MRRTSPERHVDVQLPFAANRQQDSLEGWSSSEGGRRESTGASLWNETAEEPCLLYAGRPSSLL